MSNAAERSSRVGRAPVAITEGVKVEISGQNAKVTGPKGSLEMTMVDGITVAEEDGKLLVRAADSHRRTRGSLWSSFSSSTAQPPYHTAM